jgi:hypothetical protein
MVSSSPNTFRVIKLSGMVELGLDMWPTEEKINAFSCLFGNPRKKIDDLEDLRIGGRIRGTMILKKQSGRLSTGFICIRRGQR